MEQSSESIQDRLNEALIGLIDQTQSAAEFLIGEIPEVLQQLLHWKLWESLVEAGAGLGSLLGAFVLIIGGYRFLKKYHPKPEPAHMGAFGLEDGYDLTWAVASTLAGFFGTLLFSKFINLDWLQILIAPKVYLLEYAGSLLR